MIVTSAMKELRDMKFQPSVAYNRIRRMGCEGGGEEVVFSPLREGERVTNEIFFQHCRSNTVSAIHAQKHFNSIVSIN